MVWFEICNWQLAIHSKFCLTIHVWMSTSILTFNRSYQILIDRTMFWSQHPCWEVMFWSEHPYCQSMCQSQHPYSQLTDDSKFYLTSNDLISTFLLATTVTCFQILRVTEKSCRYVKFCLTNNALKIYQTRKTDCFTHFQTLRIGLKIRWVVENFWQTLRCLKMWSRAIPPLQMLHSQTH